MSTFLFVNIMLHLNFITREICDGINTICSYSLLQFSQFNNLKYRYLFKVLVLSSVYFVICLMIIIITTEKDKQSQIEEECYRPFLLSQDANFSVLFPIMTIFIKFTHTCMMHIFSCIFFAGILQITCQYSGLALLKQTWSTNSLKYALYGNTTKVSKCLEDSLIPLCRELLSCLDTCRISCPCIQDLASV